MLAVALTFVCLIGSTQAKAAKADEGATAPQLTYTYLLTRDLQLDAWIVQLKNSRYVENVLDILDAQYKLPRTLEVRVKGCNKVNAMYSHKKGRITLCAELLPHFESIFRKALTTDHPICSSKKGCDDLSERVREWTLATTTFVLWHEMGHAFVQELKLPASGREEDVADQVAVYVANMGEAKDANSPLLRTIKGAAYWFQDSHEKNEARKTLDFNGHHSLGAVRRTNLACWAYGRSPDSRKAIGESIPPARRKRCPKEWRQLKRAFDTLLKPHRFPEQVRKARFAANTVKRRSITHEAQGLAKKCRSQAKAYARLLKQSQPLKKEARERLLRHFFNACLMNVWTPKQEACAAKAKSLKTSHRCLGLRDNPDK